jgi:hypothetical protein
MLQRLASTDSENNDEIVHGIKAIQRLQFLTDKLHRLTHLLNQTIDVAVHLENFAQRLRTSTNSYHIEQTRSDLQLYMIEQRIHESRLTSLANRSTGINNLVRVSLIS